MGAHPSRYYDGDDDDVDQNRHQQCFMFPPLAIPLELLMPFAVTITTKDCVDADLVAGPGGGTDDDRHHRLVPFLTAVSIGDDEDDENDNDDGGDEGIEIECHDTRLVLGKTTPSKMAAKVNTDGSGDSKNGREEQSFVHHKFQNDEQQENDCGDFNERQKDKNICRLYNMEKLWRDVASSTAKSVPSSQKHKKNIEKYGNGTARVDVYQTYSTVLVPSSSSATSISSKSASSYTSRSLIKMNVNQHQSGGDDDPCLIWKKILLIRNAMEDAEDDQRGHTHRRRHGENNRSRVPFRKCQDMCCDCNTASLKELECLSKFSSPHDDKRIMVLDESSGLTARTASTIETLTCSTSSTMGRQQMKSPVSTTLLEPMKTSSLSFSCADILQAQPIESDFEDDDAFYHSPSTRTSPSSNDDEDQQHQHQRVDSGGLIGLEVLQKRPLHEAFLQDNSRHSTGFRWVDGQTANQSTTDVKEREAYNGITSMTVEHRESFTRKTSFAFDTKPRRRRSEDVVDVPTVFTTIKQLRQVPLRPRSRSSRNSTAEVDSTDDARCFSNTLASPTCVMELSKEEERTCFVQASKKERPCSTAVERRQQNESRSVEDPVAASIEHKLAKYRQRASALKRKLPCTYRKDIPDKTSLELAQIYHDMGLLHYQIGRYSTSFHVLEHALDTLISYVALHHNAHFWTLEECIPFITDRIFFTAIDISLGRARALARLQSWRETKGLAHHLLSLLHHDGRARLFQLQNHKKYDVFHEKWSSLFARGQLLLGQVCRYEQRPDQSLWHCHEVLHCTRRHSWTDQHLIAETVLNIGRLHLSQGMLQLATVCFRDAAGMFINCSNVHHCDGSHSIIPLLMADAASALGMLGWTLFCQQQFDLSWSATRQAYDWTLQTLGRSHPNARELEAILRTTWLPINLCLRVNVH